MIACARLSSRIRWVLIAVLSAAVLLSSTPDDSHLALKQFAVGSAGAPALAAVPARIALRPDWTESARAYRAYSASRRQQSVAHAALARLQAPQVNWGNVSPAHAS